MDDTLERRAIWLAALSTFFFVVSTLGFAGIGSREAWRAALFVATVAATLFSVAAAGLAFASEGLGWRRVPRKERSLALSFALLWLGLLFTAINVTSAAVEYLGDGELG
ncbi:MAG: hypothetical protein ABI649_03395 [Gaiellaceae bacterium]